MRACLLVAHGPATEELSDALSGFARRVESETGIMTRFAFLEGKERAVREVLRKMDAGDVLVLPLFVSSSSYHVSRQLPGLLDEKNLTISRGFDSSPELPELVVERAGALAREGGKEGLVLLFHGSKDRDRNEKAKAGLSGLLEGLRDASGFAEVALSGIFHGELGELVDDMGSRVQRIIIVPLFFFEGRVLGKRVPALLETLDPEVEVACDLRPLFPGAKIYKWVLREVKDLG